MLNVVASPEGEDNWFNARPIGSALFQSVNWFVVHRQPPSPD
jgi:hypothetical protein